MGLTVTSFSELDVSDVQAAQDLQRQLVVEDNPNLDVYGGVLDEVVLYYQGALYQVNKVNIDRLRRSMSLSSIQEDPNLADDDTVSAVLSNFLVTRNAGVAATGNATIVVSKLSSVTIPAGAVFTAGGKTFTCDTVIVARTSEDDVTSDTDRVLTATPDGKYVFQIPLTASTVGTASNIGKGTVLTPARNPVNFVKAYAAADFIGGVDTETNEQLLARLAEGAAIKAMSGPLTMKSSLRAQSGFENLVASSVVGMGDPEMLRDKHWLWPIGGGGRVDWYIRPTEQPSMNTVEVTATLINKIGQVWQIALNRATAPAMYRVESVVLAGAPADTVSYTISSVTRGYNVSGLDFAPDVISAEEAAFTPFQTAVIQFVDTDTATGSLTENVSTALYDLTTYGFTSLEDAQTYVSSRTVRNPAGDVLVKAPVPCFVDLSFTISVPDGVTQPDADTIKDGVAAVINRTGFSGRLAASVITEKVHSYLSSGSTVGAISMNASILHPDDTTTALSSTSVLEVPDLPSSLVTARTVGFICRPSDITIAFETVAAVES